MDESPTDVPLTDTQLRILTALCRPIAAGNRYATPATNQEIADEVFLGVDAVKGHLRALYRKFGIEDLPQNQKRARLVELAIESGYVGSGGSAAPPAQAPPAETEAPGSDVPTAAEPDRRPHTAVPEIRKRPIVPYLTLAALILVVVGVTLLITGVFSQGPTSPAAPSPATFRTEVAGYCRLALEGAPSVPGAGRAERASAYLEVIETMRGRLQSLARPTHPDVALERFSAGLTTAADYTSDVAQQPPAPGSGAEAKDVSELTFAAGQVQAGAVGYKLGHDCISIGDLIARSAQNASAP